MPQGAGAERVVHDLPVLLPLVQGGAALGVKARIVQLGQELHPLLRRWMDVGRGQGPSLLLQTGIGEVRRPRGELGGTIIDLVPELPVDRVQLVEELATLLPYLDLSLIPLL